MLILTFLTLATSLVGASAIEKRPREAPLQVELVPVGNTKVKALVKNTDTRGYNLFPAASFLDDETHVNKLDVRGSATRTNFRGLFVTVSTSNLSDIHFLPIQPNETIERTIDIAELYDVRISDRYTVSLDGYLPYAEMDSTILSGRAVAFSSNTIVMDIDGDEASLTPWIAETLIDKRAISSCSDEQQRTLVEARKNCAMLAISGHIAAQSGHLMQEYFASTSATVISEVRKRLFAVAEECISASRTSITCDNGAGNCQPNVLAVADPDANAVIYCDFYFEALAPLNKQCGSQSQASVMLHELTHCSGVYSPHTWDYAYSDQISALNSETAVLNADTYAKYVDAVYGRCSE